MLFFLRFRMLQTLKNKLYDLIVRSGVITYIIPLFQPIINYFIMRACIFKSEMVTDASGATLNVTKYNGKLYMPFALRAILAMPNRQIRKTDVLLCGYPKTGGHWMFEIISMVVNQKSELTKHGKEIGGMIEGMPDILLDSLPSPRVLNTHFLYEELPKGVKENKIKIVYTVRNPKDTLVSYYNHHLQLKGIYGYSGNINDYFNLFMEGNLDNGSYFDNILHWDKAIKTQKNNPILLVSFEDMKMKPTEVVLRVAAFLDKQITEEFASDVVNACSFNKMKAVRQKDGNIAALNFRKGDVGDWRNWLTDDQSKAIDEVWSEKMKDCLYQPTY